MQAAHAANIRASDQAMQQACFVGAGRHPGVLPAGGSGQTGISLGGPGIWRYGLHLPCFTSSFCRCDHCINISLCV